MKSKTEKDSAAVKTGKNAQSKYVRSITNSRMLNYNVYIMSFGELLLNALIALAAGALAGFIFFGDLFQIDGVSTSATHISNLVICGVFGIVAAAIFLPLRKKQLLNKRNLALRNQFRDMLASLSGSLSAGKNITDSFMSARKDLVLQHSADSLIVKEVDEILEGVNNNINIEDLLNDFAQRSGQEDIKNFCNVFDACYRRGGNLKVVIRRTNEVISDKMACKDEIDTKLASNRTQLNMMTAMPVALVGLLRFTNGSFAANFAKPAGIIANIVGIVIFIAAYLVGQKIINVGE